MVEFEIRKIIYLWKSRVGDSELKPYLKHADPSNSHSEGVHTQIGAWGNTVLDIYNRPRNFWCTFFLGFLQLSKQLIKIQKLTIYHLKGLIVDILILEGPGHSTIRDRPDPLNVKKANFSGELGVASPWSCHTLVLLKFYCPQP